MCELVVASFTNVYCLRKSRHSSIIVRCLHTATFNTIASLANSKQKAPKVSWALQSQPSLYAKRKRQLLPRIQCLQQTRKLRSSSTSQPANSSNYQLRFVFSYTTTSLFHPQRQNVSSGQVPTLPADNYIWKFERQSTPKMDSKRSF
jgi:hypothetical protein